VRLYRCEELNDQQRNRHEERGGEPFGLSLELVHLLCFPDVLVVEDSLDA